MANRLRLVTEPKKPRPPRDQAAEWVDPSRLKPWAGNPRKNQPVDAVMESIKLYGFGEPIVARRANFEIIAGHTRWKAAMKLMLARVPVRLLDLDEEKAHALCLADNRLGELADWDMPALHAALAKMEPFDIKTLGWNEKELRAVEKAARVASQPAGDEQAPELPEHPVTQPGDLWKLGDHRLVCGDATNAKHVALACGGKTPFLMVTDPPYGLQYDPEWRTRANAAQVGDTKTAPVANDDRGEWHAAFALFGGDVAYVWHAANYCGVVEEGLRFARLPVRQQIIWVKQQFVFGSSTYQWKHEGCWYAVRKRRAVDPQWCGDRNQTTVWEIQNSNPMGGFADDMRTRHATQKPIECMARPMRNHGSVGMVVYDPFVGSGTSIVAAQQLERVCIALEIDPACCDVIVDRWQKLTGGKAKRAAA